jgi:hypothetical protein
METTIAPPEWSSEDRHLLQEFLSTTTGTRLLPKMVEQMAPLLETGDTNTILIRSGKVLGFQESIQAILLLARPEPEAPPAPTSEYPDPADDSKWNDGQKIKS